VPRKLVAAQTPFEYEPVASRFKPAILLQSNRPNSLIAVATRLRSASGLNARPIGPRLDIATGPLFRRHRWPLPPDPLAIRISRAGVTLASTLCLSGIDGYVLATSCDAIRAPKQVHRNSAWHLIYPNQIQAFPPASKNSWRSANKSTRGDAAEGSRGQGLQFRRRGALPLGEHPQR
jgi:hypothetical protein